MTPLVDILCQTVPHKALQASVARPQRTYASWADADSDAGGDGDGGGENLKHAGAVAGGGANGGDNQEDKKRTIAKVAL